MQYRNLLVEIKDTTAIVTFNRPAVLNAMNTETVTELGEAIAALGENSQVRVIILTGTGKAFIAGADIAEMSIKTPAQARAYSELGHRVMNTIQNLKKPVIAAVNGYALGGGIEVALSCDICIASELAKFGLPETILGVIPGWGATQRAARLIGTAQTKELVFTGELIDARKACEIGLINRVVPHEQLMDAVMMLAQKIGEQSPLALSMAKKIIHEGLDKSLLEGCRMETEVFSSLFDSQDQKEGMKAFLEKRKPQFSGR
ncbi:MAG: enoyl-CoA hydratase-related protein [Proteobacteria bacterium]|nr:enoyl-CoA hydratase-related protein [Pseudomonadota bacterium]